MQKSVGRLHGRLRQVGIRQSNVCDEEPTGHPCNTEPHRQITFDVNENDLNRDQVGFHTGREHPDAVAEAPRRGIERGHRTNGVPPKKNRERYCRVDNIQLLIPRRSRLLRLWSRKLLVSVTG